MNEEVCDKCKTIKDAIRELNRELVIAETSYFELTERVDTMGKGIHKIKTEIDTLQKG